MLVARRGLYAAVRVILSIGVLISHTAKAAEDLSSFGTPVETTKSMNSNALPIEQTNRRWPAHVCAEIQRAEKVVISGPLRPVDRGIARGGLLMLEQLHCGIDVSKKLAADQTILIDEQQRAQRDYQENMAAAQRASSRPQEPIVVKIPQAAPTSSSPDPAPPLNCFTTRFGGGMSTTTCR